MKIEFIDIHVLFTQITTSVVWKSMEFGVNIWLLAERDSRPGLDIPLGLY
jgi:hypothetical protein